MTKHVERLVMAGPDRFVPAASGMILKHFRIAALS